MSVQRFDVITLFPPMFDALMRFGVTARALELGLYQARFWNPRDFAIDNYRSVDDRPYGGGPGMVMLPEVLTRAIDAAKEAQRQDGIALPRVVYLSPQGRTLDHAKVLEMGERQGWVLLAGRYEGIDQRVIDCCIDEEVSVGDYVLSGGELAAMVLMDTMIRQIPGALGDAESAHRESFSAGLLDYPQFTRPEHFEGQPVPAVLLSGHHAEIARWRVKQALGRTALKRPDLLEKRGVSSEERRLIEEFLKERAVEKAIAGEE